MFNFSITADDRLFQKTMEEYIQFNKRQPGEIINAKLYFIALRAMNETKRQTKAGIRAELDKPSKHAGMTIGKMMALKHLRKIGKRIPKKETGLASEVERLINKRTNATQFLRSGWFPALRDLDFWNRKGDIKFAKKFAPKKPAGIKKYGVDKGGVRPAKLDRERTVGTIFNAVGQGKQATKTVKQILMDGLQKGVRAEIASMRQYINLKYNALFDKFKRTGAAK